MSKKHQQRLNHEKHLRKLGVKNFGRPKLKGAIANPLVVTTSVVEVTLKTSDIIPANGTMRKRNKITSDKIIGQPYNKGPLMVLSSKEDLRSAHRRDR